jgi:SAM-dependent methyltransferase
VERSPIWGGKKDSLNLYWQTLKRSPSLALHATLYSWAASLFSYGFVLDLGCEYGFGSMIIEYSNPGLVAVGIDFDQSSLITSQGLIAFRDSPLVCGRAEFTPFRDSSFSGICAINLLHLVDNVIGVLSEIKRLLKPSGIAVIANTQATCGEVMETKDNTYFIKYINQVFEKVNIVDMIHGQPPGLDRQSFPLQEGGANWVVVTEK